MTFAADRNLGLHHLARARELYAIKRYDLAIVAALDACASDPGDSSTFVILANSYERLGQIAEAEAAALRAIELGPHSARAQTALGMVRLLQRRYPDALRCFREGIRLAPEYADGYRLAAHAEMTQTHYANALRYVDRALELEPEAIHALEVRAMVLQKAGRTAEAERAVAEVLARAPESIVGLRHEGLLQLERGNRGDALAAFREALRLDPTSAHVRAGYERVILRTSLARHLRGISIALFAVVWAAAAAGSSRLDFASFLVGFVAVRALRRCIVVNALRRDEVSRTFLEAREVALNPLVTRLAAGAYAAAVAAGLFHDRAFALAAGGVLLAAGALRGTALPETTARGRVAFRAAAAFFAGFGVLDAALLEAGGRVPFVPAVPLGGALTAAVAVSAIAIVALASRQPLAFRALVRVLAPPRRAR